MTRTEHERAARRRGELVRDHGSRKVFSAIDAQRRLNARSARGTRSKTVPVGPGDPRYAYLPRTYDYPFWFGWRAMKMESTRVTRTMTASTVTPPRGSRWPGSWSASEMLS